MSEPERWHLEHAGVHHELEVSTPVFRQRTVWRVDGEVVAEKTTGEERTVLFAAGRGAMGLHFTTLGMVRRATWFDVENEVTAVAANQIPAGGIELEPEPGTKGARRVQWRRDHPGLYRARQTMVAAIAVALGALATWLVPRLLALVPDFNFELPFDLPSIPWPDWDLPQIPWPDIPWPNIDLPNIDLPNIDLPGLPGWVWTVLGVAKYVVPVLFALAIATAETRKRAARQAGTSAQQAGTAAPQTGGTLAGQVEPDEPSHPRRDRTDDRSAAREPSAE